MKKRRRQVLLSGVITAIGTLSIREWNKF